MFLLVPAHLGCPGQNPESRKMVVVVVVVITHACTHTHTHTHTHPFYSPLDFVWDYPGKLVPEPIWILLKQETVSGSGITGPYANLHLTPDIQPLNFLQAECPF